MTSIVTAKEDDNTTTKQETSLSENCATPGTDDNAPSKTTGDITTREGFLQWLSSDQSQQFRDFTEKRFCSENVTFYDAYRKLEAAEDDEAALSQSKYIYDHFLKVIVRRSSDSYLRH